jgi:adenosine deaminase
MGANPTSACELNLDNFVLFLTALCFSEPRSTYPVYNLSPDSSRWDKLASWVVRHRLSSPNVRWMIQVPRLYHLYRRAGDIKSMDEMLQNIFRPLFEVTLDPSSHPDLHVFLRQMAGIDSVDDESTRETPTAANEVPADEWTHAENRTTLFHHNVFASLGSFFIHMIGMQGLI